MARALTVKSVEAARPDAVRREIPDSLMPGLYLVVQPSGAKSWAVRYRQAGRPCKLTLGGYPVFDLGTARARARETLHAVASGRDPHADKKAALRGARDSDRDLVATQLDLFFARHVVPNLTTRTAGEVTRALNKDVRATWGNRRVQDIDRRDVVALLDHLVDRGSPVAANRLLAYLRRFFGWLVERSVLDASPADRVKAPTGETSRDRALSDDELRRVWLGAARLGFPLGPFVQLLLLTGQRRSEVAQARWAEFQPGAIWTIPKERAKNGLASDMPLSQAAQAVLDGLPRIRGGAGFVLTGTGAVPIAGYSACKTRLDGVMLTVARDEAASRGEDPAEVEPIAPWRLHDLRRTLATGLAKRGIAPHVVEAILNHRSGTISGVAAIYNRHAYLDEKRHALELWAHHVMALVEGRPETNVVALRG